MGENIGAYSFSWGKLKERENLKVSDVDGNIILKYILTKSCGSSEYEQVLASCEHGNEFSRNFFMRSETKS